ncbi:hypothetical protein HDE_14414 [Halotydeus destructor]|nr:hypothetical protein HDE_14414 [Halotydeus destructor]
MSASDQMKALRARLDAMQAKLADAKQTMAEEKERRVKTNKKLETIQSDAAELNKQRQDLTRIKDEMHDTNNPPTSGQ